MELDKIVINTWLAYRGLIAIRRGLNKVSLGN
jgi:hypothetical protein